MALAIGMIIVTVVGISLLHGKSTVSSTTTLLTPANEQLQTISKIPFSWQDSSTAGTYRLQVTRSNDRSFKKPVIDDIIHGYKISYNLPNGTYYWRVGSTTTKTGAVAYWSQSRDLRVAVAPAAAAQQVTVAEVPKGTTVLTGTSIQSGQITKTSSGATVITPQTKIPSSVTPPATATTTPPTTPLVIPPTPPVTVSQNVDVATYGAIGNGTTDDTVALQRAFDSIPTDKILYFPSGKIYRHTAVLRITRAGIHISGPGTILATNQQYSGVWINADNVLVDGGLIFKLQNATQRWSAWEQMKIRLMGHTGITLRNITVDGAAAAGIYIGGSSNYLLDSVTVKNTQADGIHNTAGANHGTINSPYVENTGDDGVAVVSYSQDGPPCSYITINSPTIKANTNGRGISVVGGSYITYNNVSIDRSNAAAIYISTENEFSTTASQHIAVNGGTITNANTNSSVDHGAILLYNSRSGYNQTDILIQNLTISNTRASASRQVGILAYGGTITNATIMNLTIIGGPSNLFVSNTPSSGYNTSGWTYNGNTVASHIGF